MSTTLYNNRSRHLGFFNMDIKLHRDTGKPVVLEISNGTRGLYRPVDNGQEDSIPKQLWQWLAEKAPAYFCTRFDPQRDQLAYQKYNTYYELDYMQTLPNNRLGQIENFYTEYARGQFPPLGATGILVNQDIAGQAHSATLMRDYPELLLLNGIGAMNKLVADKIKTWQAFQAAGLSAYTPQETVIQLTPNPQYNSPQTPLLKERGFNTEKILNGLTGDNFIIKPPQGRNGLGIMPFTRNTAQTFFKNFIAGVAAISTSSLPPINTKDPFYYDNPLRYWARPEVTEMIVQEFIPGQHYMLEGKKYEPTLRVAVGIDMDTASAHKKIETTYLGGYAYLPPQALGEGSWHEQVISNQYRGTNGVKGWHRALGENERNILNTFLQNELPKLYIQLLLEDVNAYKQENTAN